MHTLKFQVIALFTAFLFVVGGIAYSLTVANNAEGAAFTGSAAVLANATTTTVGPDLNTTIFAKTTSCTGRTISTNYGAIFFSTGDVAGYGSTTLASGNGVIQAASTTVMYDGGTYGCGRWTAEALATTSITVMQYQ